jgi:hypothetical protein
MTIIAANAIKIIIFLFVDFGLMILYFLTNVNNKATLNWTSNPNDFSIIYPDCIKYNIIFLQFIFLKFYRI